MGSKNLFFVLFLCLTSIGFAQQAGMAGKLLKNEATESEMQKSVTDVFGSIQNHVKGNKGFSPGQPNFHQNFGYSEVFLRIPEGGNFTVQLGDQMISNNTGRFRFYDLFSEIMPILIFKNNYLVYRSHIQVINNYRLVLDFFTGQGLFLLDSYPVPNYGFSQWDDMWNSPYQNFENHGMANHFVMNNEAFSAFMTAFENNRFEDGKIDFLTAQAAHTGFTSHQIALILKSFRFDDKRLQAGKLLYPNCVDSQNFFQVYSTFRFEENRKALMNFVSNYR